MCLVLAWQVSLMNFPNDLLHYLLILLCLLSIKCILLLSRYIAKSRYKCIYYLRPTYFVLCHFPLLIFL